MSAAQEGEGRPAAPAPTPAAEDGHFEVRLEPSGRRFDALPGLSVLASAEFAGIPLESSCRNGTCRTCLLHARSGSVRHAVEWPGLSAEEKREGWILPCVAHARSDLVLVAPAIR